MQGSGSSIPFKLKCIACSVLLCLVRFLNGSKQKQITKCSVSAFENSGHIPGGIIYIQHAKKVVSDSLGLVDSMYRRAVKSILLTKMFLGLVEMMFGMLSFSLPEWQALKVTFFAP